MAEIIKLGQGIRFAVGWLLNGDITSNPTEWGIYTKESSGAIEGALAFGEGAFGDGAFGIGYDATYTLDSGISTGFSTESTPATTYVVEG